MNRFLKPIQVVLTLMVVAALSSCALGQVANPSTPTVDIGAVKTAAAATAFVELTKIAGQASATSKPTQPPTVAPATNTPSQATNTLAAAQAGSTTQNPAALSTATVTAGGLPATETPLAPMAGTPPPGTTAIPSLTPIGLIPPTSSGPLCYNSKFIADVTIPDGTVMVPYEKFQKVWRIQNTGTCAWDQGFGLTLWAGPSLGGGPSYYSNHDQKVGPGGIVDIGIEMRAPVQRGEYIAHWTMINDSGKTFGADFTVYIIVK